MKGDLHAGTRAGGWDSPRPGARGRGWTKSPAPPPGVAAAPVHLTSRPGVAAGGQFTPGPGPRLVGGSQLPAPPGPGSPLEEVTCTPGPGSRLDGGQPRPRAGCGGWGSPWGRCHARRSWPFSLNSSLTPSPVPTSSCPEPPCALRVAAPRSAQETSSPSGTARVD